jgi:hypothetical protein
MSCDCTGPEDGARKWRTPEGLHVDVRGLEAPESAVEILQLIDSDEADAVVIAHLDDEPIFLYPELDDRGWSYEIVAADCGDPACEDDVKLQLVRWGR